MAPAEALDLFRKQARLFEGTSPSLIETAATLVKELRYFALSVSQAGAYISATLSTPKQYLNLYRSCRDKLLREHDQMKSAEGYQYCSIRAAWMISYAKLSAPAKLLLQLCACMHHDNIMESIVESIFLGLDRYESKYKLLLTRDEECAIATLKEFRKELGSDGNWDAAKFRKLISELQSYSLISFIPEQRTCSIHPLVHEWAGNMCGTDKQVVLRHCTAVLLGSFTIINQCTTTEELAILRALVPHVDCALEETESRLGAYAQQFGHVYWKAGRWDDKFKCDEHFKEICVRGLGDEHLETLIALSNLAITYWSQHRFEGAEALQLQVMEAVKRVLGPEHPFTLTSIHNLASTYQSQNRFDEAEALHSQVVKARKRLLGAEHPQTLTSIHNLASTYRDQERYDEAEALYLQVVEARKRVLGAEHPDTLDSIHCLASTYWAQKWFDEAEVLYSQVVETQKRVLGPEHPFTLTCIHNLASTYQGQERFDEAEVLYSQVVEARQRIVGTKHPDTLLSMCGLALTYKSRRKLAQAEILAQQAVSGYELVRGTGHRDTQRAIELLAELREMQENHASDIN